jgi:hypothetical protein
MLRPKRFAQLALAVSLGAAVTSAAAFNGDPNGVWAGTIKCSGVSLNYSPFSGTAAATMSIDGSLVVVYDGWTSPYIVYAGAYIPDAADPGNKGTFASTSAGDILDPHQYSETGQAKLERRKDGKVSFDGKSYAISTRLGDIVSAMCEWRFNKTSDTPLAPPGT